jgi:hypothetical protein
MLKRQLLRDAHYPEEMGFDLTVYSLGAIENMEW